MRNAYILTYGKFITYTDLFREIFKLNPLYGIEKEKQTDELSLNSIICLLS